MKVSAILSPVPVSVEGDAPLARVLALMDELDVRHIPVMERGELAGVLSERDLLEATGWRPSRAASEQARELMHAPVETITDGEDAAFAARRMLESGISCLPVVRSGALVGVVSELDVIRAFVSAVRDRALPPACDPRVAEIMVREVRTLDPGATVDEALELFGSAGVHHVPLVHEGALAGIVSDRDLLLSVGRGQPGSTPLGEVVPREVVTTQPWCKLSEAAELFLLHKLGALPAVDRRKLVGILSTRDVLRHFSELPAELPARRFRAERPPKG